MDKALFSIALPFDDNDAQWATDEVFRATIALEYLEHVLTIISTLEDWYASRWASFGKTTAKWQADFRASRLARKRKGMRDQVAAQHEKFSSRSNSVRMVFSKLPLVSQRILLWNFADSVITFSLGDSLDQTGDAISSWMTLR